MKSHWHLPWKPVPLHLQAALTVGYFVLASLSLLLAMPGTNASAVWVPSGLAIAACLRLGPAVWPAILLGSLVANGMVLAQLGLGPVALAWASLATALGNLAETFLATYLIERFTGTRHPFNRVRHVLQFILAGAVLATAASALVGTLTFCVVTGNWQVFRSMGASWWLGDAAGVLVFVPVVMTFRRSTLRALPFEVHRDAFLAILLVLAFWFGVCPVFPPLAFFFFPLLVLSTARLGPFYASGLVALLAVLATGSTLAGMGPFLLTGVLNGSLLLQQGFICTLAITTLVLASALQERRTMEERLLIQNRLYRLRSEVSQALVHAEGRTALLGETCRILVELGGFHLAWIGFRQEAAGCLAPGIALAWTEDPGTGPLLRMDSRGPAVDPGGAAIPLDDLDGAGRAPWRAEALARGYRAGCAFPLLVEGKVAGSLMAAYCDPESIGAEEGRLLRELAGDLGFALEAMETDMDLSESERRFRTTLENVDLIAVALGADATVTYCNDYFLRLTGWSREEVLGRNWFDQFLPADTRERVEEALDASLHNGEIRIHNENEILTRTWERRLIRWNNTILRDRHGAVAGSVSLGEDITDTRRAEAALVQRAEQLAAMNDLNDRISATLDVTACSRAALEGILAATASDVAALYLQAGPSLYLLDAVANPRLVLPGMPISAFLDQEFGVPGAIQEQPAYRCESGPPPPGDTSRPALRAWATLPLRKADQLVGKLVLGSSAGKDYQGQATFLEILASQISTGIQNALMHERLKLHAADLERRVTGCSARA